MTYKGIYRDGIVTIQGEVDLRNGATVDVNLRSDPRKPRRKAPSPKRPARKAAKSNIAAIFRANGWELLPRTRMTKKQRIAAFLDACGAWKDRPEWKGKTSVQVAAELRRRAPRGGRNV